LTIDGRGKRRRHGRAFRQAVNVGVQRAPRLHILQREETFGRVANHEIIELTRCEKVISHAKSFADDMVRLVHA